MALNPQQMIDSALGTVTQLAHEALRNSDIDALGGPSPPSAGELALAYDLAFRASSKQAQLFLRDLLILRVCLGGGPWTNDTLLEQFASPAVFGRPIVSPLRSQLILAFNTIVRCGRAAMVVRGGRETLEFDEVVARVYGGAVQEHQQLRGWLFEAYRACALTSPDYKSKCKSIRLGKQKPRRPKGSTSGLARGAAAAHLEEHEEFEREDSPDELWARDVEERLRSEREWMVVDHGDVLGPENDAAPTTLWSNGDEVASSSGSELSDGGAAGEVAEAARPAIRLSRRRCEKHPKERVTVNESRITVKNTFFDDVEGLSDATGKQSLKTTKTCPPKLQLKEAEDCDEIEQGSDMQQCEQELEDCDETEERSDPRQCEQQCESCRGFLDRNCWKHKTTGKVWCDLCWKGRQLGVEAEFVDQCPTVGEGESPGGYPQRYEERDPVQPAQTYDTKVEVRRQCCLAVAQEMPGACMLVPGRERGPLAKHGGGLAGTVLRNSTFRQAALQNKEESELPACRHGGTYMRDVVLMPAGKSGEPTERQTASMIYASSEREETSANQADVQHEMGKKILNVLRICYEKGHDKLILGAWGCGWRKLPAAIVADAFQDALFGDSSDVKGAFREVVFAILPDPTSDPNGDVPATFERVFASPPRPSSSVEQAASSASGTTVGQ